jgi:hypothetical protein
MGRIKGLKRGDYIKFIVDRSFVKEYKKEFGTCVRKGKYNDLRDFCAKKGFTDGCKMIPAEVIKEVTNEVNKEEIVVEEEIVEEQATEEGNDEGNEDAETEKLNEIIANMRRKYELEEEIIEPEADDEKVEQEDVEQEDVPREEPEKPQPKIRVETRKRKVPIDLSKIEVKQPKNEEYYLLDEACEKKINLYISKFPVIQKRIESGEFRSSKEKLEFIEKIMAGSSTNEMFKMAFITGIGSLENAPIISRFLELEGFSNTLMERKSTIDDLIDELLIKYADDFDKYTALGPEYRLALVLVCAIYATHTGNKYKKRADAANKILSFNRPRVEIPRELPKEMPRELPKIVEKPIEVKSAEIQKTEPKPEPPKESALSPPIKQPMKIEVPVPKAQVEIFI